jgi:hypothetical protein
MEELLAFALLLEEEIVDEDDYLKRLDELFLENPNSDDLLFLEWETNIKRAVIYIRTHVDFNNLDCDLFGSILMEKIRACYEKQPDIKSFAGKMYRLWKNLPGKLQVKEPFFILCYADDPLSWGDEEQTRNIYEYMMNYYKD